MPVVEMLNIKQAAQVSGRTELQVRLAIRLGVLRAYQLPAGGGLLVRKDNLMEWSKSQGQVA